MKKTLLLLPVVLAMVGCGTTIRSSSDAFRSGRVLDPGEYRVATETSNLGYVPYPLIHYSAARGFPGGWELEAGGGFHGILIDNSSDNSDDMLLGPELFVTKNLVAEADRFYASLTAGLEVDVTPYTAWTGHGGINLGFYPARALALYGQVKAVTISGGIPIPIVGLGLGVDGPFVFKLGAYLAPFEQDSTVDPAGRPTALWPFYYGIQVGGRF